MYNIVISYNLHKLLLPFGPLQLDLVAHAVPVGSGSCMLELQPGSQPAGIGLLFTGPPTSPLPEVTGDSPQQKVYR